MIDLIRASAVPATLMHSAAKGSLSVPPEEMIEILVYLATQNPIFGQQARFTLAGWDEAASKIVAANPKTPKAVLDYMISGDNLRPALLPVLLENPSVSQGALIDLASSATREIAEVMRKSARVGRTPPIQQALSNNPNLIGVQAVNEIPESSSAPETSAEESPEEPGEDADESEDADIEITEIPPEAVDESADGDSALDENVDSYLTEHATEIAAEGEKPFHAIGGVYDEIAIAGEDPQPKPEPTPAAPEEPSSEAPQAKKKLSLAKKIQLSSEEQRGSALQKISRLDIKGRIQLAMKGTKEERSILIRDGTKLVALAVLESPKISDGEVERFASQKNVLEAVLRAIPMKRRFAKHYPVVRNLVSNPRTPLDLSLGLMKHLMVQDLRNIAANKEVSDTVRKLALKMFKQKSDPSKKNV